MYQQEIEYVRDKYNEDRSDPLVPRSIPPIAGRIMWIRQLYKRIENPMNMFKSHQRAITKELMQKCIKMYNALVTVFIHYELIYHKAWYDSADIVSLRLHVMNIIVFPECSGNHIRLRLLGSLGVIISHNRMPSENEQVLFEFRFLHIRSDTRVGTYVQVKIRSARFHTDLDPLQGEDILVLRNGEGISQGKQCS